MAVQITVPTLGESVTEATVAKWLKKVGDTVEADEPVVELETDKVSLEVPSPSAGVLSEILVEDGADVAVGAILGNVDESAAPAKGKARKSAAKAVKPARKESPPMDREAPAPQAETPAPAAKTHDGGGELAEVVVPKVGESVTEGTVAKWLKKEGDHVALDEPIVELETDKATLEVPSTAEGVLKEIRAAEGTDVEIGAVLAVIAKDAAAAATPVDVAEQPRPKIEEDAKVRGDGAAPALSPAVRKLIDEHDLHPSAIEASGPKGRITKEDVLRHLESAKTQARPSTPEMKAPTTKPAAPAVTKAEDLPERSADPRGEERVRMSRLRQRIAERLKEAQNTAAMLTTYNEARMDALMKLRATYRESFEKKHGVRLGFLSFFVKASIIALKEIPAVNAEIYGDQMIYKNYYDIGVAVGTPQGLVVPVLRDADKMSFAEIEIAIADFGKRARDGKLTVAEMTGGTFTISNGGVYGSLMSMPILNPPQSGILGMHKIQKRPIVDGDQIRIADMMYLALTYDHRIVDGREAVTFLVRVKDILEDPQRLLIDV